MKHQAIRCDFTTKELLYLLFRGKTCPRCGCKMIKKKDYETKLGAEFDSKREPFLANNVKVKYYSIFYICESCGAKFKLSELAK